MKSIINNILIYIYAKVNNIPKDKVHFSYIDDNDPICGYTCNKSGYIGGWRIGE